jgi:ribosome-binding protein aMBF1 (putative translation factor)
VTASPAIRAARQPDVLSQHELAQRWRLSPRTLERWRWLGQGPAFLRLGRRIAYRLSDIEAFEAAQRQAPSEETAP